MPIRTTTLKERFSLTGGSLMALSACPADPIVQSPEDDGLSRWQVFVEIQSSITHSMMRGADSRALRDSLPGEPESDDPK